MVEDRKSSSEKSIHASLTKHHKPITNYADIPVLSDYDLFSGGLSDGHQFRNLTSRTIYGFPSIHHRTTKMIDQKYRHNLLNESRNMIPKTPNSSQS
jgi:hypothetical protein